MTDYQKQQYEYDLNAVKKYLAERGIVAYSTYPANDCVGVSYGGISAYAIVRGGEVVDFIVD